VDPKIENMRSKEMDETVQLKHDMTTALIDFNRSDAKGDSEYKTVSPSDR